MWMGVSLILLGSELPYQILPEGLLTPGPSADALDLGDWETLLLAGPNRIDRI